MSKITISYRRNLLVEKLGIQKALLLLERGKGDSVKEIADYWGNSSIEDIFQRVKIWKSQAQKEQS